MSLKYDYLIIGSGIIGLSMARAIRKAKGNVRILVIDKENHEAEHASGRNSGVLHAGFYYTADSLKAKFTVEGNRAMKDYCFRKNIPVNEAGKLVVARDEEEASRLAELEARGKKNGSTVYLVDVDAARELEPNIRTHKKALYSPETATIDPAEVCRSLKDDLMKDEVNFRYGTKFISSTGNIVKTTAGDFQAGIIVNCAGLYADKIARVFGFSPKYIILPFKGLYLKYTKNTTDVKMNIYPVPNLKNPFLGVHFTKTVEGGIKIGPTATPAFWRENYAGLSGFDFGEFLQVAALESKLMLTNAFNFRDLAVEEIRKYSKRYFISLASEMVKQIDPQGFTEWTRPGIRAQLLDRRTSRLVQDFVVEGDEKSVHILNAVSPAFTCAFPFCEYIVNTRL